MPAPQRQLLEASKNDTVTANFAGPYPAPDIAAAIARALDAARDRAQPALDGDRTAQKYAGMARDFRASAWEHLDKGDLPQASNKAWGLVAETVKAISAHYGGIIHTHRAIAEVVDELSRLAGNAGDTETRDWISAAFLTARGLHTNFYENEMRENTVRGGLISCERLSRRLYELFGPAGHSP